MTPFSLTDDPSGFSLILHVGDAPAAEKVAEDSGHLPNGYFWMGTAERLIAVDAPELAEHVNFDPESSMFAAYGTDRASLEKLGDLLSELAADPAKMTAFIEKADADGFNLDD